MVLDFINTTYHPDTGTIATIEQYVNGHLHGEQLKLSKLGRVIYDTLYVDGLIFKTNAHLITDKEKLIYALKYDVKFIDKSDFNITYGKLPYFKKK